MLNNIFSIDTKSSNRIIIKVLGIKFKMLKKSIKDSANEYIKLNCPVSEIPPATGILRKVQLANLKMLEIFDKICQDNNLEYWLDYGNLLGAFRHRGFIPWDDDIDVGMPRKDYEEFIKKFENGFSEYQDLYLYWNNNGKNRCFIKVKHKNLPNIAIDIFPYDFWHKPITLEEKKKITAKIKKFSHNKLNGLFIPIFKSNHKLMRKRMQAVMNKIFENNLEDKTSQPPLFYGIDAPHIYDNFFFDYDVIYPLKKVFFENKEYFCPNKSDAMLKQVYGDYMSLPSDCYPRHTNSVELENMEILEDFIKNVKTEK